MNKAADRVDRAEKHAIFRRAAEITHALGDALHHVGDLDLADFELRALSDPPLPRCRGPASTMMAIQSLPRPFLLPGLRDTTTFCGAINDLEGRVAATNRLARVASASPPCDENDCRFARAVA